VSIFDVASNRLTHTVPVGPAADQIAFTRQFAYVRSVDNEFVNMIKLGDVDKEVSVTRFPAGEKAPKESPARSLADAIVPAKIRNRGLGNVDLRHRHTSLIMAHTPGLCPARYRRAIT